MKDGLNLRIVGDIIAKYFEFGPHGELSLKPDCLQMDVAAQKFDQQLKADTGFYKKRTDQSYNIDVVYSDRPAGSTPTVGAGIRLYGPNPLSHSFRDKQNIGTAADKKLRKKCEVRERKIERDQLSYMELHKSVEPSDKESSEYLQWLVEEDQVMTGGGMDNTKIGDIQKTGLNFVIQSGTEIDAEYKSMVMSYVVEGCLQLQREIEQSGLKPGSLRPKGCHEVRLEQETDGMLGDPVLKKAFGDLDSDIATRLLLWYGIDTNPMVGRTVQSELEPGKVVPYRVIDALAYILDRFTTDGDNLLDFNVALARIQKHAWKLAADGSLEPKKSKARIVQPQAALPGIIEAMTFAPFNDCLKDNHFVHIPSLQDKPTRVAMTKGLIEKCMSEEYIMLAADWSAYDATVKADILATIIYYCVRPFYQAEYQPWVDLCTYIITHRYLVLDTSLCELNPEEYGKAKEACPFREVGPYTIFGVTNGLASGLKFTHVGGSLYGLIVGHYVIPRMLGFEPMFGIQAGDDTGVPCPRSLIKLDSAELTYKPWEEAAAKLHMEMNATKQIWKVVKDEPAMVFLQDVYHAQTSTWGAGSSFRPLAAVFFSEREKGLSVGEQLMAEIARMNQGADGAFVRPCVENWLQKERALGALFKEYGVNAFRIIVDSIGDSIEEIAKRIDVGSFTFGVNKEDMQNGTLPILPIIAEVASSLEGLPAAAEALKLLKAEDDTVADQRLSDGESAEQYEEDAVETA